MLNKNLKMNMNMKMNMNTQVKTINQNNIWEVNKRGIWEINSNVTQPSKELIVDPINLITQFYISNNASRQKEIVDCLIYNINNPFINYIYLITEKSYSVDKIGLPENINTSKIKLINIMHA